MSDDIDWSLFRFPPPPPKRWGKDGGSDNGKGTGKDGLKEGHEEQTPGPNWAAPPIKIISWHFDDETWTIIHPVQRKKIDLQRVSSKRRLTRLAEMVVQQKSPKDLAALWIALNEATGVAFSMSVPEMLAFGPSDWEWPTLDHDASMESHDHEVATKEASSKSPTGHAL